MKQVFVLIMILCCINLQAQRKSENLVIITLDGMRWQEVFGGADSSLLRDKKYTKDSAGTNRTFWKADINERRELLFPFLWKNIAKQGQLYGNRWYSNKVDNANRYRFSYPGYNEIFTGYPDTLVNSNDKVPNKNTNVLEFIHKQQDYVGKVATFATWDVFPFILNRERSGMYVNADRDSLRFSNTNLRLINDMQYLTTRPIGVRPDVFTYFAAREYLKAYQPKVLYIAFDETDDFAHAGEYDQYLKSAFSQDAMIADLWKHIQGLPQYRDKTTLLITCDHGRGDKVKDNWRHHGAKIEDAGEIWIAAIGPDTEASGEQIKPGQLYQEQLAATIAQVLNLTFTADHPVAQPIKSIYIK